MARWGLIVLVGLGGALLIDIARQSLATDLVAWRTLDDDYSSNPSTAPLANAATPPAVADAPARPRLIRFTADWCGPCQTMKSQVFSQARVADAIASRFDAFSVDLTQPDARAQALSQRYLVEYLPTLLVTDARGRELARLDHAADSVGFLDWLDRGWVRWQQSRSAPSPPSATPVTPHLQ